MFDDDEYFFQEEFIFPEEGGVTGTRVMRCPYCNTEHDLVVDVGNDQDEFQCNRCGEFFVVNWINGTVSRFDD